MFSRFLIVLALALAPCLASAQSTPLQGGPFAAGHVPVYGGLGSGQPLIQDSGAANGTGGPGLKELLLTKRGVGFPPYATGGTGPLGTNLCDTDGPVSGPYHYLCLDPNAQGGGMLAFGAGNGAPQIPFNININGQNLQFPFVLQGILGPNPSIPGVAPVWGNSSGTLLVNPPVTPPITVDVGKVCPGGTADDAPCLRGLFASNTNYSMPMGATYTLCSLVPPLDYPASDNANVLIHGLTNFHVQAYGVTFQACPGLALSAQTFITDSKNWSWDGGTIIGSRTALQPSDENVAMALVNDVNFRVHLERVTGYGGNGAAFAGDWNVNGQIDVDNMDGVGHGFDTAFLNNVSIHVQHAIGADTNGKVGTGQVGQTFFSNIYDVPFSAYNRTGVAFSDTQNLTLTNTEASNFTTGVAIASGYNINFINDNMHDMPGLNNSQGLGYLIYYNSGGVSTSVGHPPHNINIIGGASSRNGSATGGIGLLVAASAIPAGSADTISAISVVGSVFDSNNNEGIDTDGGTAISNLSIAPGTVFSGAAQTTGVSSRALAKLSPLTASLIGGNPNIGLDLTRVPALSGIAAAIPNNQALNWQASQNGGLSPIISVGPSGVPYVRPASAAAYGQLQDYSGNAQLQWGAGGLQATATLQDQNVAFANLPTTGRFSGQHVYCTDCRNPGEAAGQGTGALVYINRQGTWTTVGSSLSASN